MSIQESAMSEDVYAVQRTRLEKKKAELTARLDRVTANVRRAHDQDSKERAQELEDSEVVDALGNEARVEVSKINEALRRMDNDEYGICDECGSDIDRGRLDAHPYARKCIDCARFDEHRRAHS
jgi:DnaK suppressor protein